MQDNTLRTRLLALIQKSRKAVRLYNNVSNFSDLGGSALTNLQVLEWKNVNAELVKRLTAIIEVGNSRKLISELFSIRDYFFGEYSNLEQEQAGKQKELISAAQVGDFVRCFILSNELVTQKARLQAMQAAHHELELILKRYKRSIESEETHIPNASLKGRFIARALGLDTLEKGKKETVSLHEKSILKDQDGIDLDHNQHRKAIAKVIPLTRR